MSAQLKMSTLNQLSVEVNLKKDKDTLKIYENKVFKVFYFLDKPFFFSKISKKEDCQQIRICFSTQKKHKVGIPALFNHRQSIKKVLVTI